MKKYKLIKEYPGSPELGYISKPKFDNDPLHYWSGNWFKPELFPEFWEEVAELCVPIGTKFTVWRNTTVFLIKRINTNGKVYVDWEPSGGVEYGVEAVNSHFSSGTWKIYVEKPVLFITEDGVEIRENDPIYEVNDLKLHNHSCSAGACINYHLLKTKGILYFSTKEAAQEYIDSNKLVYTKKQAIQMLRAFDKALTDYDEGGDDEYIEFLL